MRVLFAAAVLALSPLAAPAGYAQHAGMAEVDHSQMGHDANASMLAASSPSDGAVLDAAPRTLALAFMHPVVLQTVAITGPDGAPVRATFRRPASAAAAYTIALPALSAGTYTALWSATGMGHDMQGQLSFTVR